MILKTKSTTGVNYTAINNNLTKANAQRQITCRDLYNILIEEVSLEYAENLFSLLKIFRVYVLIITLYLC